MIYISFFSNLKTNKKNNKQQERLRGGAGNPAERTQIGAPPPISSFKSCYVTKHPICQLGVGRGGLGGLGMHQEDNDRLHLAWAVSPVLWTLILLIDNFIFMVDILFIFYTLRHLVCAWLPCTWMWIRMPLFDSRGILNAAIKKVLKEALLHFRPLELTFTSASCVGCKMTSGHWNRFKQTLQNYLQQAKFF